MRITAPTLSLSAAATLLLAAPLSGQRAFEGVITYQMTAEGQNATMKTMSRGAVTRMEMQAQGMPGEIVMLMNGEAQVMQVIMASMGMYMEMDLKQAAQMAPQGQGQMPEGFSMEKAGSDEVAGIRCENYRFRQRGQPDTEACIATGMGYWMGGMSAPRNTRGPMPSMGPDFSAYMKEFQDGMVPLRVRVQEGSAWKTVLEATAVERKALDEDLFKVPTGLRKMSMP